MIIAGEESFFVGLKSVVQKRITNTVDRMDNKMFIVNAGENFGGDFIGFEKMVQISFVVILTTFAVTFWHEGGEVVLIFGVFDIDAAV